MKSFILIACSIFLFACAHQKNLVSSMDGSVKVKKDGRKIYGTVAQVYLSESGKGDQTKVVNKPKLSFKVDSEYYFIKISSSSIVEQDFSALIGKKVEVLGELVGEGFGEELPSNISEKKKSISGKPQEKKIGHILVYEILEID